MEERPNKRNLSMWEADKKGIDKIRKLRKDQNIEQNLTQTRNRERRRRRNHADEISEDAGTYTISRRGTRRLRTIQSRGAKINTTIQGNVQILQHVPTIHTEQSNKRGTS
eukprot:371536-Amphidinium_carterae.1